MLVFIEVLIGFASFTRKFARIFSSFCRIFKFLLSVNEYKIKVFVGS